MAAITWGRRVAISSEESASTMRVTFERQLKGWRREKKQALIHGTYDKLPLLARTSKTPR